MIEAAPTDRLHFLVGADLGALFDVLHADGRRVIGPTIADGVLTYEEIETPDDLPTGWRTVHAPGSVRLERAADGRRFSYGLPLASWKRFVYPPRLALSRTERTGEGLRFEELADEPPRLAFLGVRACEIAALDVLGRAVSAPPAGDADEARRRDATLVIAVECAVAGATCFCSSAGTGPEVEGRYDLALTEFEDGFLVRAGSEAGDRIAAQLPLREASTAEAGARAGQLAATRAAMAPVPLDGVGGRLRAAADHPRWAQIAERCLSCASCTLACPTCFCTSVEQRSDLDATESIAERRWDSCFTGSFAAVAGGSFRSRPADRYRQWLTHKFSSWWDQFGTSGCVGCGRCISWCPAGIDIREELLAIAGAPAPSPEAPVREPLAASLLPLVDRPPLGEQPFAAARVIWTAPETADVTSLRLEVDDAAIRAGAPGQFVMAALPGFPPAAISISRYHPDGVELTVRAAGPATAAIGRLHAGDELGLRGPLGRPWPLELAEGLDIAVIAGGIGLAPLRPVIDAVKAEPERFGRLHLCYGAKTPTERLFIGETFRLRRCKCVDVAETVDRAEDNWGGRVGLVPCLLEGEEWVNERIIAFVCGPERMMQVVATTLTEQGVPPERIFLTLERHMECGVGLCGHCQMGRFFVCRDGPVFSLAELQGTFGVEGI